MRFRVTLFVFVALFQGTMLWAQRDCGMRLTGRVMMESGQSLASAEVVIKSLSTGTVTDSLGNFVFEKICEGEYVLEFRFVGYKTLKENFIAGEAQKIIVLSQESKNLQEVVVEEKLDKVERSTNYATLNSTELREAAGKTLGESLKALPGVSTIQAGPGIFKPVIHGVHSQRVLILNHGIRQEGQQWGAEHAPEIDPFIAANMVVIKDAGAIKYGTDALGGVIVINPSPLPEKAGLGGSLNSVIQTNGRSGTMSGMIEGGITGHDGWGWRVQGTAKGAGDYHAPDYSLTNTGVREYDFSTSAGYHGAKLGAEIFFSHFQTELGILRGSAVSNLDDLMRAMEQEPPNGTKDFSYNISEPRQEVSHNLLKLSSHWTRPKGEWRMQYGFQSNFRKEFDIRMASLAKIPAIDLELRTQTLELEYETADTKGRQFCLGINGMYQYNKNVPGTQRIPFIPDYTSISAGPFAVAKLSFKKWIVDLGTRYDFRNYAVAGYDYKNTLYKSDLAFHNVSASVGATRSVGRGQTIKINLSSAWRPPHVAELYSLGTHQSAAAIEYGLLLNESTNEVMNIHDTSFKVEQALKAVGTWQLSTERLELEATVYSNMIFNYIYLQPRGVTKNVRGTYPYFRYTQTDALFVGMDIAAEWKLNESMVLKPKVSLLSASDVRNNDYLVFIPSNRVEVALRYKAPGSNFYVEPKVNYVAKQNRAPRVITVREINDAVIAGEDPLGGSTANFDFMAAPDGYALVGIAAGISTTSAKGRFDLRLAIENALNTSYREYTNRLKYYADDIGRNISLSVKYTF